jgi:nitrate reductase gamma subunit
MTGILIAQALAVLGLAIAVVGIGLRWRELRLRPLPIDRTPAKGSPGRGVAYAFTLGMAPWAKESTRLHAVSYLRGVGFHLAVFLGLAAAAVSPWWPAIPEQVRVGAAVVLALGAILGAAGSIMRLMEPHLRSVSIPDDHFAVAFVTLFLIVTGLALWNAAFTVPMYVVTALMLAYIPLGKIRHCLYFFVSRVFFGRFVGRRGVLPHPAPLEARGL